MSALQAVLAIACLAPVALANDAISMNPPSYAEDLTVQGSDWLWAAFSVMAFTGIGVTVWGHFQPIGHRTFHWISAAILFTASVAYFSMASNLGKTPIAVEFTRYAPDLYEGTESNPYRSIWYARYIDWVITTPLLLLDLLLATGLPLSNIFFTVFMDEVMIVTGLIGALVASRYKWGFFAFGCAAMLYIFWVLVGPARRSAYAISKEAGGAYIKSTGVLLLLWLLYPVAWGLADGGNVIPTDSEMIFYGVLDVCAKPGFILLHLFALSRTNYEALGLQSGHFSVGSHTNQPMDGYKEKGAGDHLGNGYSNGHANGHTTDVEQAAPPRKTNAPSTGNQRNEGVPDSNLADPVR